VWKRAICCLLPVVLAQWLNSGVNTAKQDMRKQELEMRFVASAKCCNAQLWLGVSRARSCSQSARSSPDHGRGFLSSRDMSQRETPRRHLCLTSSSCLLLVQFNSGLRVSGLNFNCSCHVCAKPSLIGSALTVHSHRNVNRLWTGFVIAVRGHRALAQRRSHRRESSWFQAQAEAQASEYSTRQKH
jgi:hypothetical protein